MTDLEEAVRIIDDAITIDDPETNTYIPVLNLNNEDEKRYFENEKRRVVKSLKHDNFYNTIVIKL